MTMQDPLHFRVDALFVYPIKACAGLRVARLDFLANGMIAGDREWVVVDGHGEVVWQGSHPRLAVVRPSLQGAHLVLSAPGEAAVIVPLPDTASACEIRIWNDISKQMETFAGFDAGPQAARLLENVTQAKLRLIRLGYAAQRRTTINPVHLVSRLSLSELNQHLLTGGDVPAQAARLRPNIVLDSEISQSLAFIEEHVSTWRWGTPENANTLTALEKCVRCIVPDVNPDTGAVSTGTSRALAALSAQRYPGEPSYFGVYAKATRAAQLTEGEMLEADLLF